MKYQRVFHISHLFHIKDKLPTASPLQIAKRDLKQLHFLFEFHVMNYAEAYLSVTLNLDNKCFCFVFHFELI